MSDFISDEEMAKLEQSNTPDFIPDDQVPRDYEAEATLAADKKYEETKPGVIEAAAMGVTQGGLRNFADEIAGVVGGDAAKAALQDRVKRSKDDQPLAYTGGEIASKVATLPATLNPLAAAGIAGADTFASQIGDDKSVKDASLSAGIDAATAGTLTKIMPGLMSKLGEYGDDGMKWLSKILQTQADESTVKALGGSQKQIQDLGSKLPGVAEQARATKVVTPLASSNEIAERADDVVKDVANQTKPLYEAAKDTSVSTGDLIKGFDEQIAKLDGNPGMSPVRQALESRKQDLINEAQAGYNPSQIREYRGAVDKLTNFQSEAPAQEAKQITRTMLRDKEMGLLESVSPDLKDQNEALFKQIHFGRLIEDMADKGAARSTSNNLFGINSQILGSGAGAAIGGATTGDVEGMAAGAGGLMAARELVKRYGPQMAGVGLDKAAKAIAGTKFASMFANAAARGPQSIIALHQALRSNPEYQALVGE